MSGRKTVAFATQIQMMPAGTPGAAQIVATLNDSTGKQVASQTVGFNPDGTTPSASSVTFLGEAAGDGYTSSFYAADSTGKPTAQPIVSVPFSIADDVPVVVVVSAAPQ